MSYMHFVRYEWDEAKRATNRTKHRIDFAIAEGFDWTTAFVLVDGRRDYGEVRYQALGFIGARLHMMVLTLRGTTIRVISLRKANGDEVRSYETKQKP